MNDKNDFKHWGLTPSDMQKLADKLLADPLLYKTITPITQGTPSMLKEFKEFAMRGNVIDLAVGVVIGAAFTAIVNSMVSDLFNPILGLIIGGIDFSNIFITLKGATYPTLDAAQKAGAVTLNIGLFLNAIIKFVIVAFAIFILVKQINRFKKSEAAASPPQPTQQEILLREIRDLLAKNQN